MNAAIRVLTFVFAFAAAASASVPRRAPAWTRERPRFFEREGRRFASAVGRARDVENRALARVDAEDRARADLLKLMVRSGAPENELSGPLPGARMTDSYASRNGEVFVRMEVPAPR